MMTISKRVARALDRARVTADPIDAAAALAFEITRAQGFYEGNKRTAVLIARWAIRTNASVDPDQVVPPDDRVFADLLIAAARGEEVGDEMRRLFRARAYRGER